MAAYTEGDQIIFEKMFPFGGSMRIVAVDTSFLHRIMLEFYLCHSITNILMAIKTEFISCLQKNEFIFRCVGIMAFYAISLHDDFMAAFGIFGHNSFMAFGADLARILIQQLPMGSG